MTLPSCLKPALLAEKPAKPPLSPRIGKDEEGKAFDFATAPRRMNPETAAELLVQTLGAQGAAKAARLELRKARQARSKARHQFWNVVLALASEIPVRVAEGAVQGTGQGAGLAGAAMEPREGNAA